MRTNRIRKAFVYFVCFSFLLTVTSVSGRVAEAKERRIPIGEMVSQGNVYFEARPNQWRGVEGYHFPVFQGVKVKTEKGSAAIVLKNNARIELGKNSMICFAQEDVLALSQGTIEFRVPPAAQMSFKVGTLSITNSRQLQASVGPSLYAKMEDSVGLISLQPKGAMVVNSLQGSLAVVEQDRKVLVTVTPDDPVQVPSSKVLGKQRVMVAQAGDTPRVNVQETVGKDPGKAAGKEMSLTIPGIYSEEYDELELWLIDFAKYLEGYEFPPDLDTQKFFSILEERYPNKEIIEKLKEYYVSVRNERESYDISICDKQHLYCLYRDFGRTKNYVDYPYWPEGERPVCEFGAWIGALAAGQFIAGAIAIIADQGEEDKRPICP